MGLKPIKKILLQKKPNLVDWRSQNIGSKGQPNCKNLLSCIIVGGYLLVHSYDETVMLVGKKDKLLF